MIEIPPPFGDVLQIGMGRKKIASTIQTQHPRSHTIIENDPFLLEKNKEWLELHPHVKLIKNLWREALSQVGLFDAIYSDLTEVGAVWPEFAPMRYSDKDIDLFCKETAKTAPEQLFHFLHELAHNGQISIEQLEKALHDYKLRGTPPKLKMSCRQMMDCLEICLAAHMRQGSFFAACLTEAATAYEDPRFSLIAVDPYLEVRERGSFLVVEKLGS